MERQASMKVSVIIPVYNGAKYLKETIDSILQQSLDNFEIIAVDDCSTDGSEDIIKGYNSTKMIYIRLEKNHGGPATARNEGIKRSHGEYIAFIDQDDLWVPKRLEIAINLLENNPKAVLLANNVLIYDERKGKNIGIWWPKFELLIKEDLKKRIIKGNILLTSSSVIVKKDYFQSNLGFNELYNSADDYELWYRIIRKHEIILEKEPLTIWRYYFSSHSRHYMNSLDELVRLYKHKLIEDRLSKEEEGILLTNLNAFQIRLANYLLARQEYSKAIRHYDEMLARGSENYLVKTVLFIHKINPRLASFLTKIKIKYIHIPRPIVKDVFRLRLSSPEF